MVEHETALATNRKGWNHVAKYFHGSTALPEYGPLAPTEDTLRLLDEPTDACVLELDAEAATRCATLPFVPAAPPLPARSLGSPSLDNT